MIKKLSALLVLALGAVGNVRAADAFSNVDPSFTPNSGYPLGGGFQQVIGYRFTSSLTGALTGFRLAIYNAQTFPGTKYLFEVSLYDNSASDTLGTLLGAFSGLSTGDYPATTALASVMVTGPNLNTGSQYWLVASTTTSQVA